MIDKKLRTQLEVVGMIYLDNSSTTKPHPLVVEAVLNALNEDFGNPSSLHNLGLKAEKLVKKAREEVARLIKASPEEIVFTSGGTESNFLAIKSILDNTEDHHVITTAIEHPSVASVFSDYAKLGYEITYLPVDREGHIDLEELRKSLRKDTALVSIMAVNNELGSYQPIEEISKILKPYPKLYFHVDAVQALGKRPISVEGIDLLTMSGHKIEGPKGIGALYIKKGRNFISVMPGGGQERGLRGGTENVPGIAGFGVAAKLARERMGEIKKLKKLKDELAINLKELVPDCQINSPGESVTILNVSFPKVKAEVLLHSLEAEEIYVSTGSACSAKKKEHRILEAIGLPLDLQEGTIRFSLGWVNDQLNPREVAEKVAIKVKEIQSLWG